MGTDPATALSAWLSVPVDAMVHPLGAVLLFAFGCFHALLPGHGKALLAVHGAMHDTGKGSGGRHTVAMLDGMVLAMSRALVAFALVVAAVRIAGTFGIGLPLANLRVAAGGVLILIGAHVAWEAFARSGALHAPPLRGVATHSTPEAQRPVRRSLIVLALTPEPVALALASYGVVRNELPLAAVAALSLAFGMGLILGTAGLLARQRAGAVMRLGVLAGWPVAILLVATGTIVALGA